MTDILNLNYTAFEWKLFDSPYNALLKHSIGCKAQVYVFVLKAELHENIIS